MGYKTGRSRTLNVNGGFSGHFRVANFPPFDGPCGPAGAGVPGTYSTISVPILASNHLEVNWHLTGPTSDAFGVIWWGVSVQAQINGFCGVSNPPTGATDNFIWGDFPSCDPHSPNSFGFQTLAVGGTYSMQIVVDEYVSYGESGSFPSFGGSPAEDAPTQASLLLYELPQIGSTITCTITVNGVTATSTGIVSTQDPLTYSLTGSLGATTASFSTEPCDLHVTGNFLDAGVGTAYSRSNQNVTAVGSGLDFSIAISSGGSANQTGSVTFTGGCPKSYALAGVVRGWNGGYPDPLTLRIQRSSVDPTHSLSFTGSFADSNTQRQYSVASSLNGVAEGDVTKSPISVDEYADLKLWIDPASLTTAKEDTTDWRVMMRGHQFAGLGISQAASLVVDDGAALTVAAGNYKGDWTAAVAAISSVSGEIKITCGAGVGNTASRSFTTASLGSGFSGYRYLRLKIRADADGRAFSFKLGTKSYAVDYAGAALKADVAAGTLYIDLCAQTATSDSTDTKWPLPTVDGPLWGVTGATGLQLLALVSSATYYVDEIALCRHPSVGASKVSFQPAFTQWTLEHAPITVGDTTTTDYARRSLQGDTDGRLSVEEPDFIKTVAAGPSVTTTTYAANTIASMIGAINAAGSAGLYPAPNNAGWTATGSTSATDPAAGGLFSAWLNCNRPAHWLYGAGALYAKISPDVAFGWYYGLDLDATSAKDIPAQMVFDVLSWFPGCTDPFGYTDGPTVGTLYVRAAKVMRGQSWGLVADANGAAAAQTVYLKKHSSGVQEATGLSDGRGEYFTGSTWAREGENYDTIGPTDTITRVMAGRYRYRACFGPGATVNNPFNYADRPGLAHYHETKIDGKKAVYSRSIYSSARGGWGVDRVAVATADGTHKVSGLRVVRDHRQTVIAVFCLAVASDGSAPGVWRAVSDDDGATWSDPVSQIPDGTHPTIAIGQDSVFFIEVNAAYVGPIGGPGVIKAVARSSGTLNFSAVFSFVDAAGAAIAVKDDTFHVQQAPEGPGRWILHCLENGKTDTSRFESYDDCLTWTLIT